MRGTEGRQKESKTLEGEEQGNIEEKGTGTEKQWLEARSEGAGKGGQVREALRGSR